MIIYQVLCAVPPDIEQEWKEWMLAKHIPEVIDTGCFLKFTFNKVVKPETEGNARYVIHYSCASMDEFIRYGTEYAPELQKKYRDKYGESISVERMVLERLVG